MKLVKSLFVFLALFLLSSQTLEATHLVGGYIRYQYLGQSASGVKYLVTITSYRDCKPGSIQYADDIDVCVYNANDKRLYKSFNFPIVTRTKINPPGRTDCNENTSVCLEQGIYRQEIVLPRSSYGYIIKWEVCCRNEQVNLRNDQSGSPFIGQTYQTTIPPSNFINSSPRFNSVPVPFMCLNDTVEVDNYAVDPDGTDVLIYKLATPWYGASLSNNYPGCASFYTAPQAIAPSDYAAGYNGNIPFGINGIAKVDPFNGICTFKGVKVGNYAVALDVEEYRNGVLISTTRLDLQILIINCSPNNKPTISTSQQSYNIEAGARLCFNVTGNDKDSKQFLTLSGFGDLLTGANGFKGNKATFSDASGQGTVTSQFCWQTSCEQASDTPYLFSTKVIDDGCPSKYTIKNVPIYVKPFTGKVNITGPGNICQGSTNVVYNFTTTANSPSELNGVTYIYNVVNGIIVSKTSNSVTVIWSKDSFNGRVEVTPVSQYGCPGKKGVYNVTLVAAPSKPVLLPIDTVCENANKIYTVPATAGLSYKWSVTNGSIFGSNTSNSITITWGSPGKGTAKVVAYNVYNCPSDTAVLNVWVSKPVSKKVVGKESVCPNNNGFVYKLDSTEKGNAIEWFVTGGTIVGSSTGNSIVVNWGNPGIGSVKAVEINKFGCKGDTMSLAVLKGYALTSDPIAGDTNICENTQGVKYKVLPSPNTVFHWSISGGTIVSGQGSEEIVVDWGGVGNGSLSLYSTSLDPVNNLQCISAMQTVDVHIWPYPSASTINGTKEVCQQNTESVYLLSGMPGSVYLWSINGDTSKIKGQGTGSILVSYSQAGTFNLRVVETSQYGCVGNPVLFQLIVHPKPNTSPIQGDSIVCYPNLNNHVYSVNGLNGSVFQWWVNSGSIVGTSNTNSITVNWSGAQNNTVKVLETSDFGCPGDTVRLNVFYDNPFLILDYITVNPPPRSDDGEDLFWRLGNAPRYNAQLMIERRKAGSTGGFQTAGTVNGSVVTFNEGNLSTDSNAWEYRIKGFDLCGRAIYSNIHTNVFLSGYKPDPYSVAMNFTPYLGWGSATIRYDLYRLLKNSGDYELVSPNITDFKEAFANSGLEYYTQCYRVKATKLGTDTVTWSNDVCFNFDPILFIPDAFSPNDDEHNNLYSVSSGALKTFNFQIFNRWGEKVYETDDKTFKWDGKYKDNNLPQDVYMFYCTYTGFDGRLYSTKGTITLLR